MLDAAVGGPEGDDAGFFRIGQGHAGFGDAFQASRGDRPIGENIGDGHMEQAIVALRGRCHDGSRQHAGQFGQRDGALRPSRSGGLANSQLRIGFEFIERIGQTGDLSGAQGILSRDHRDIFGIVGQAENGGPPSRQDHLRRRAAQTGQAGQGFRGSRFGGED